MTKFGVRCGSPVTMCRTLQLHRIGQYRVRLSVLPVIGLTAVSLAAARSYSRAIGEPGAGLPEM